MYKRLVIPFLCYRFAAFFDQIFHFRRTVLKFSMERTLSDILAKCVLVWMKMQVIEKLRANWEERKQVNKYASKRVSNTSMTHTDSTWNR